MHTHHVTGGDSARRTAQEAGARLATLNNDLIAQGNLKGVTVGAHFSRERVSESGTEGAIERADGPPAF